MRKNEGITLVALVITIIVLIILAGVTINVLLDQNGLINKTKEATQLTRQESAREKVNILLAEYEIKQGTENQTLSDFLTEKLGTGEIASVEETDQEFIIEKEGYEFTISKSTREITNVVELNVKISIVYPDGMVGETAKAVVTVENNKKTVDSSSLVYGWSNSKTIEPSTWTSFHSGDTLTQAVAEGETWFLWTKANYVGGTIETENVRISIPFYDTDRTPPTGSVSRNPNTTTTNPVVATITTSEEIETPSGWTKTSATTYTKTYSNNTTENVSITDLYGNVGSVTVIVSNIFQLPAGFTMSAVGGETDIDTGLVVVALDGSEFVWVSVPNPVLDVQGMNDTQINAALAAEVTAGRYPMAIKVNGTDYKGVGYLFTGTTSVTITPVVYSSTGTSFREPATLTDTGYDNTTTNYTGAGITGITNAAEFQIQLQNEYNAMVNSVVSRGGFFIGRYETSIRTGSIVQSKKNITPMTNTQWYGCYQRQKAYTSNNSITGINSGMIWGSQWDQVLIWMRNITNPNASNNPYILNSTGMGNYSGSKWNTGISENCKVKNIYDMAGNVYDRTMEAQGTGRRILRGGSYLYTGSANPASLRAVGEPTRTQNDLGTRLMLY